MRTFVKKNYKAIAFISSSLIFILYVSYWSGNNFKLHFTLSPNFSISNINQFWLAFSSLTTLFGIVFALFRFDIINFLYPSSLTIELNNKKGTVFFQNQSILISYLIRVVNAGNTVVENVDFYYQSIRINSQEDKLIVRRPMAWARKEEGREQIEIFDYDQLDFIYGTFNIYNNDIYYRFEKRNELINIPDRIESISDILISSSYFNQKNALIYKATVNISSRVKIKVLNELSRLKNILFNELTLIDKKLRNDVNYAENEIKLLKLLFSDDEYKSKYINPQKVEIGAFPDFETYVNEKLILTCLERLISIKYYEPNNEFCIIIDYFSELFEIDLKKL